MHPTFVRPFWSIVVVMLVVALSGCATFVNRPLQHVLPSLRRHQARRSSSMERSSARLPSRSNSRDAPSMRYSCASATRSCR